MAQSDSVAVRALGMPASVSAGGIGISADTVSRPYTLNIEKSLVKKLKATKRATNISFMYKGGNVVVEADTASFELIKFAVIQFYSASIDCREVSLSKSVDAKRTSVVKHTIRVQKRDLFSKFIYY